jgi:hypothetical protein
MRLCHIELNRFYDNYLDIRKELCLGVIKIKRYFWNLLISIDQGFNTILGGDPDETISSRMGKHLAKRDCPFCNLLCTLLNLIQKDHCIKSIEKDEGEKL